ncbi:MAG: hypothetical protein C0498_13190 [Anaerolinea sp.]|nr:hypothetical protein [Anaerolinea sp.]
MLGVLASGCSPLASKGTMPPPGANGQVDPSSAPDFLAVAGRDAGIAGYARKEDVLGPGDAAFPVYGDDLRTVVGQMVPGKGFVPVGVDPATVLTFAVEVGPSVDLGSTPSGQVVLYVRNDAAAEAWVTVLVNGQPWNSSGFWGQNMGVGCYAMPGGSRLVLLDRSPEVAGAGVLRQLYVRGQEVEPPSLWITIGKDGSVQQGTGVPAWSGAPQTC